MSKGYYYDKNKNEWVEILRGSQGLRGERGPIGPQGPQGVPGPPLEYVYVSDVRPNSAVPGAIWFDTSGD